MVYIYVQKYIKEARTLLSLSVPVIFTQISQTAMSAVDTIMSGSISSRDMAIVAVGTSIWLPIILFAHGLLLSLTPMIAQLNGSGQRDKILNQVHQGFWLAIFVSLLVMLLLYNSHKIIGNIYSVEPILAKKTVNFLRYLLWGTPGYLCLQVLRCQCEGLSKTKPGMIIGFIGLLINIPINYIFIYGKFGIKALGGVGCGIATASVYWIMFLIFFSYIYYNDSFQDISLNMFLNKPDWFSIKRLLILGLPMALALFFEVTLFALVSLLIAPLGVIAVSSHQIAMNFSSLMFVFPLSIGVAATIRVGFFLGQKNVIQAKISTYSSLIIGIIFSLCTALFTIFFYEQIVLLYNKTPSVVKMASNMILLAAAYQVSDSIQVIGSGVLRAYKDTRSIFVITFIAYWLLGLPFGYIFALTDIINPSMGPSGFWIGFIIGLTSSACLIMLRIHWIQKQNPEHILQRSRQ